MHTSKPKMAPGTGLISVAVLRSFAKGLTFSGFDGQSLVNQRG